MSDYDNMLQMFDRANIKYSTDWNREVLFGCDDIIVKWISIYEPDLSGNVVEIQFKFSIQGGLISISPLTDS